MKILCPTCHKTIEDAPADFEPRPFCSVRCKLLDLGNWLDETYRVSEPIDALAEAGDENPGRKPN